MSSNVNRLVTYHTRVLVTPEQDQKLRDYATLFGQVERTLYADIQKGKDTALLKSEYMERFPITARQFDAVRFHLEGRIDAVRKQLPSRIANLNREIVYSEESIAKLVNCLPGSNQLHQERRRLADLKLRLEKLEGEQKSGRIHLCFGSKRLFHAQFNLQENGFKSHEEWKKAWREARSNQFFVLGSKNETAGCQECVAIQNDDGRYSLRVRLPIQAVTGSHLVIPGVRFRYGQERLEEALACGRALSYRFLRDANGWRVFVSTEIPRVKRIANPPLGPSLPVVRSVSNRLPATLRSRANNQ